MPLLRSLLSPNPASPGQRKVEQAGLEGLSADEHSAVLDALEWSDLDSSQDLVGRTDAALEQLDAGQASQEAEAVSPSAQA
jgi:hypothetical protein